MHRILIDAVAAAPGSGGPHVHASEVIRSWSATFPSDELVLVGGAWLREFATSTVAVVTVPARRMPSRVFSQLILTPLIARLWHVSATIATVPVLSPFLVSSSAYCFAHDWRHLYVPSEFSRARRLYRSIWRWSVVRARAVFCISRKTLRETLELDERVRVVLAENGNDHVRYWEFANIDMPPGPYVLTFGHRVNKRPSLVVEGFAGMTERVRAEFNLVVVGVPSSLRPRLGHLAEELGVEGSCIFKPFVPDAELHTLLKSASLVVLASTDEGYGLPAAEGLGLGRPVLVTSDSGMPEIFGSNVSSAPATALGLAQEMERILTSASCDDVSRTTVTSWADTVRGVRAIIHREVGR